MTMANRDPVNFDTKKFLDNYEENASHVRLPSATVTSADAETSVKVRPKPEVKKRADDRPKQDEKPQSGADDQTLDREMEYMENFIIPKKYARISRKSKQVPICEDFKKKIQKLMVFFSECGTITEYVNNVLDKHFQDYDDVIQHMSDNNLKI